MHIIYIQKVEKIETFVHTKSWTLWKKQDKFRYVFIYKKQDTLRYTLFLLKMLNFAFIYKNHDTVRYVTFLYAKIQTHRKKQDNLRYIFIYKNPDTLRYAIFH